MNSEIERLIEIASKGENVTERQIELLRKKAVDYGEDPDLVVFLLETKHKDYVKSSMCAEESSHLSSIQETQFLTTSDENNGGHGKKTSFEVVSALRNAGSIIEPSGKSKSRAVACLLALFLGWMGAHKFYMGNTKAGILYLLFSWTGIPMIIALVEVFIILFQ